jgi:DNA-binding NtrC family response regulator
MGEERNLLLQALVHLSFGVFMQIGVESSRSVDNKRIFVVEKDEIIRAALQFMLHDENETHEFATLAEAYQKAVNWKPDVILLGMDPIQEHGITLIREIHDRINGVKIAMVADSPLDPLAKECLKQGAASILAKPFTIESVRRKADILLGRRTSLGIQVHVV